MPCGMDPTGIGAPGVFVAVHSIGRTKVAMAVGGALGLLCALGAMFLGILLVSG